MSTDDLDDGYACPDCGGPLMVKGWVWPDPDDAGEMTFRCFDDSCGYMRIETVK